MKKNFFKKLSFVLALAMTASVVAPAAGAFAAENPKLNSVKKYLHLDKDGANDYNFNISNKGKGWMYAWESSDEDVVVVNEDNGVATATGVGTAKVTVYITDKSGKEVTDPLSATVVVRDNIKEVTITNKPAGDKLAVNKENDFNRSFVTFANSTKKTSAITRWTVEPSDGAKIDDSGKFTATKAGKYTVKAFAFQSKEKYNTWKNNPAANDALVLARDSYDVTVSASMLSAKQLDKDTVRVTFDSAMTDAAKNFTLSVMSGTYKVLQTIKEVKAVDTTNKVFDVTSYVDFKPESVFVVDYTDLTAVNFTAARAKLEDVARISIATTEAKVGEAVEVKVKYFNKDDVELNGLNDVNNNFDNYVTMTAPTAADTFFNGKTVYIYKAGTTLAVTATYHTYKYDSTGKEVGALTAVGNIVGVNAPTQKVEGLNAWTIVNDDAPDFNNVKQTIAAEDMGFRLFAQLNAVTGTESQKISSKDGQYFEFESTNNNVLIINPATGALTPIKEGSVTVLVKWALNSWETKKVVGAINLTINPKRGATQFTLDAYDFSLSNAASVADEKTLTITLKDQYNTEIKPAEYQKYKIEVLAMPKTGVTDVTAIGEITTTDGKIKFVGAGREKGQYVYKITVKGVERIVNVNVVTPDNWGNSVPNYYRISLSASEIDLAASAGKTEKNVTVGLYGYAIGNNTKMSKETSFATDKDDTASSFKIVVDAPEDKYDEAYNTGSYVLSNANAGAVMTKKSIGTYRVSAYKRQNGNWVLIDSTTFVVKDTQKKPVFDSVKATTFAANVSDLAATGTALAAVNECFTIKYDGNAIDTDTTDAVYIYSVDAIGNASSFYVKKVVVRQKIDNTFIDHEVAIGATISKK